MTDVRAETSTRTRRDIEFEEAQKWRERAQWCIAEAGRCFDVARKIEEHDESTTVTFLGNGDVRFATVVPT